MKETIEEAKLRQLFKNRSNCYADADDVIQAMDENCFIKTIKEWEQDKNKYSKEDIENIWNEFVKELPPINNGSSSDFLEYIKQFKKK